jgi:phage-related protein
MPYRLLCLPERVSKKEIEKLETAPKAEVKAALRDMQRFGPSPEGRNVKNLGKDVGYLWQMNLKANREQIRILYFPHGASDIVIVSVFMKTSPQEQEREYKNAVKRRGDAENVLAEDPNGGTTWH